MKIIVARSKHLNSFMNRKKTLTSFCIPSLLSICLKNALSFFFIKMSEAENFIWNLSKAKKCKIFKKQITDRDSLAKKSIFGLYLWSPGLTLFPNTAHKKNISELADLKLTILEFYFKMKSYSLFNRY